MTDRDKARESRLRSALARMDYALSKRPFRSWLRDEYGPGYQVRDGKTVIFGCLRREYEATLDQVEAWAKDLASEREALTE